MKTLGIILALFLSTSVGYSQDTIAAYIENEISKFEYDVEFQSTYKTGDNDSHLRGVLENIFNDNVSKYRYLENSEFKHLTVSNNTLTTIIPFTEWIETITTDQYPTNEYHFKYINRDNCERVSIYDKDNNIIRTIYMFWDTSYDDINYYNIRYIDDSSL